MRAYFKGRAMMAAAATVAGVAAGRGEAGVGTILLVVNNSASLNAQETARQTLFTGWGYTVTAISATDSQALFDAACLNSSMAYIVETVTSTDLATKLVSATIPVVNEEAALSDEFGFASGMTTFTDSQISIINVSHYITSTFTLGTVSLFSAAQPVRYLSGTQGGYTTLGRQVSTTNPTLAVFERGDTLDPSGTAEGRRVFLPWGNTGVNINQLSASGTTMLKRTIEWSLLPVSHWKLDDASGTTAADWIGGRNGTLVGPTWTNGKVSGGLAFNGVNDYVSVADAQAFRVTKALTIAGWVRSASWPTDPDWACPVLRKGEANPNNWQLCVNQGKAAMALDDYDQYSVKGTTALATNAWVHLAGTWDGVNIRLYVNGALNNTPVARAAPILTDTRPVYIGGRTGSTDITNGKVDDVRFYNRCLTAAEIAAMAKVSPTVASWQQTQP